MPLTKREKSANITVSAVLRKHFKSLGLEKLVTANRVFPATARVDLQTALEAVFNGATPSRLVGLHVVYDHETTTFSSLAVERDHPALVGPLQTFDEPICFPHCDAARAKASGNIQQTQNAFVRLLGRRRIRPTMEKRRRVVRSCPPVPPSCAILPSLP